MIFDFLRFKKRKAEQEELEKARDLWLNYSNHHVLYRIHHRNPVTGMVDIFKFPKMFTREEQRDAFEKDNNATWTHLVIQKGGSLLNKNVGYWIGGESKKGTIIQTPLNVDYEEITKAEFDKITDEA